MEDIARGVLEGIAIGGFAALIFNANLFAVKTLWRFNRQRVFTAPVYYLMYTSAEKKNFGCQLILMS